MTFLQDKRLRHRPVGGFEAQVQRRSGLAAHHGVSVLNTPGIIDTEYHDEDQLILASLGTEPFTATRISSSRQVRRR